MIESSSKVNCQVFYEVAVTRIHTLSNTHTHTVFVYLAIFLEVVRVKELFYWPDAQFVIQVAVSARKPSWRNGNARQCRHSRMAVSCHLEFYRTGNSDTRSADPENPNLEPNMEWIGCTVCEIFSFKLYCDLETGFWGHSRSSKAALFDSAHTTLYLSSIVTMPLL